MTKPQEEFVRLAHLLFVLLCFLLCLFWYFLVFSDLLKWSLSLLHSYLWLSRSGVKQSGVELLPAGAPAAEQPELWQRGQREVARCA